MKRRYRIPLGFVLAPPAGGAIIGLIIGGVLHKPSIMLMATTFAASYGYPTAVLLGLPMHLWLRRDRITCKGAYVAIGIGLGVAAFLAVAIGGPAVCPRGPLFRTNDCFPGHLFLFRTGFGLPFAAIFGGIAGSVVWRVARPDRADPAVPRSRPEGQP